MAWLPDTNAWIQILKQPGGNVERQMLLRLPEEIYLCSIVKAELWHGAHKYGRTDRRFAVLTALFAGFKSLPFDDAAARHYAEIRHELELNGQLIGPNDLKIAAICRTADMTIVTANTREFARIDQLKVEDWSR